MHHACYLSMLPAIGVCTYRNMPFCHHHPLCTQVLGLLSIVDDGALPQAYSHSARAREDVVVVALTEDSFLEAALRRFGAQQQCSGSNGGGSSISPSTESSFICVSCDGPTDVSHSAGLGRDVIMMQTFLDDLEFSVVTNCGGMSSGGGCGAPLGEDPCGVSVGEGLA